VWSDIGGQDGGLLYRARSCTRWPTRTMIRIRNWSGIWERRKPLSTNERAAQAGVAGQVARRPRRRPYQDGDNASADITPMRASPRLSTQRRLTRTDGTTCLGQRSQRG